MSMPIRVAVACSYRVTLERTHLIPGGGFTCEENEAYGVQGGVGFRRGIERQAWGKGGWKMEKDLFKSFTGNSEYGQNQPRRQSRCCVISRQQQRSCLCCFTLSFCP